MKYARALAFAAVAGITIVTATGCSVAREQQTVGSYVDDAGITAAVKAKMAEDKNVSATSISVETLNGTVQLSGFAKSQTEKNQAENIAQHQARARSAQQHRCASLTGRGLRHVHGPREVLHNSLRTVLARLRAIHFVAFLANSTAIGCEKTPCGSSRSALSPPREGYAGHP